MSVPRRSSNNPFSDSLSPASTGGSTTNTPPLYPADSNNQQYSSSNEKSRLRQRDAAQASEDMPPPPSYEEAAGPKVAKSAYPREKSGSSSSSSSRPHRSQSDSERHRTRVHREWPGDSTQGNSHRSGESRSHHRSHRDGKEHRSTSDREHRSHRSHRNGEESSRSRHRSSSTKHKKEDAPKPKNVDTIDKLDVTGLFGGTFHHDGPFDACTPQRNKNQKSAPVLAFPADGPNNSIKGKAPENIKESTINYVMGRTTDYNDDDLYTASVSPRKPSAQLGQYNNQSQSTIAAVKNTNNIESFDTNKNSTPVHGQTTLGLGSSTFLDGAPASETTAFEEAQHRANIGGLNRKKSLKQKFQNNSTQQHNDEDEPIRFSPDKSETNGGNSLLKRVRSLKVGRSRS